MGDIFIFELSFAWNIGTDLAEQTIGGFVSGSLQQVSVTIVHHGEVGEEIQIIDVRAKQNLNVQYQPVFH